MRYIYYIVGIFILLTLGLLIRLNGFKVEVSEPALVINDRIVSKSELDEFAEVGSYHSRGKGFLEAVITRELLIQEALREGINEEEVFRKSVEAYYEQSLIKTLMDRKQNSFSAEVTPDMVDAYRRMSSEAVTYTRLIYASGEDRQAGRAASSVQKTHAFEDLSDALKFLLYRLKPGESSVPVSVDEGVAVYRLDGVAAANEAASALDREQIESFLADQTRSAMFEKWFADLREQADVRDLSSSGSEK